MVYLLLLVVKPDSLIFEGSLTQRHQFLESWTIFSFVTDHVTFPAFLAFGHFYPISVSWTIWTHVTKFTTFKTFTIPIIYTNFFHQFGGGTCIGKSDFMWTMQSFEANFTTFRTFTILDDFMSALHQFGGGWAFVITGGRSAVC